MSKLSRAPLDEAAAPKKLLSGVAKACASVVFSAIVGALVGALLKGDKLTGLSSLRFLLKEQIPFWWLLLLIGASVLMCTLIWNKHKVRNSDTGPVPGLLRFHGKFDSYDYDKIMNANDLLVVFNDGKSWMPKNREALERRVLRRQQRLRILVLHPKSDFISTASRKADERTVVEEVAILRNTFQAAERLRSVSTALVEIRGHFLFNPFVLFLTEKEAVIHPFFYNERGELPVFVYENDGIQDGLYVQYRDDAERLWREAKPLTIEDFASPTTLGEN